MSKQIIAVLGSTGAQGGGLARAILNDPAHTFALRAITRKPDSEKAKALADQGAEVVAADLDDVQSLEAAFQGAHGVYALTNFWEHMDPVKETTQARNIAAAAKAANVKHVIWSTLEDTRKKIPLSDESIPTLLNKYKVPHLDSKGEADQAFVDSGVPYTLLYTSFYWENLIFFGMGPQKGPDGKLYITLPMGDTNLLGVGVEDIGKIAFGVFKGGSAYHSKSVGACGEAITGADMAAQISAAKNVDVAYNKVSSDEYRKFGFPGADELANMFHYFVVGYDEMDAKRSRELCRELNPEVQTFAQWLESNKDRLTC